MNRLNKTESGVFLHGRFSISEGSKLRAHISSQSLVTGTLEIVFIAEYKANVPLIQML